MHGQKHLVKCRCILPQFRNNPNPPQHHFVVFSEVDDSGSIKIKFAQCNNCGVIHKVTDICTSEIVAGKEHLQSIMTIDDIKSTLNQNLVGVLEKNLVDHATWENVKFIIDNKLWGQHVVISSDSQDGMRVGKILVIIGESLFKVDSFTKEELI